MASDPRDRVVPEPERPPLRVNQNRGEGFPVAGMEAAWEAQRAHIRANPPPPLPSEAEQRLHRQERTEAEALRIARDRWRQVTLIRRWHPEIPDLAVRTAVASHRLVKLPEYGLAAKWLTYAEHDDKRAEVAASAGEPTRADARLAIEVLSSPSLWQRANHPRPVVLSNGEQIAMLDKLFPR